MTFYEYITEFTKTYQENRNSHIAIREARCLEVMSNYEFLPIQEGDLIAGRKRILEVGFSNEPLLGRSVGFFCDEERIRAEMARGQYSSLQLGCVEELISFWKTQETRGKIRNAFPEDMKIALPEDYYWMHSAVAFPLYRIVDAYLDYDKLLTLGLDGLKAELNHYQSKSSEGTENYHIYAAMKMAIDTLSKVSMQYAAQAAIADNHDLSKTLEHVAHKAPETFLQAIQLSWLYSLISGVLNYGRMDDYLGTFLERDMEAGILDENMALRYLQSLWRLIAARNTVFHSRVIIGGKGRKNEKAADRFALLAIEATRTVIEAEPQLSLRLYNGQNPKLLEKALISIGEGRTYPILYKDEINIPSVAKALDITEDEAVDYMMFGCGEYVINKKSIGSPNGIINMLKALEITMNNGEDINSGRSMGLKLGALTDFDNFNDFYSAYKRQLTWYIEILARQEELEYQILSKTGCFLYISMLFGDCLQRGKGFLNGGCDWLGGTLETYGNINTANSLFAIKDIIYDKKLISREGLLNAMKANFIGYDREHRMLLQAEKFGNDLEGVDTLAAELHEFVCRTAREQKNKTKLHSYLVVIINNEANTILGRFTGASPDGRKAGEPMANANNPTGGSDKNGLTAMLNSLIKLDTSIHAGAVQNVALTRELFTNHIEIVNSLLTAYFNGGGQQLMITVLNKQDLINAIKEPDKYSHIMVRVGGFSARFVTLATDVQKEIASRTLY